MRRPGSAPWRADTSAWAEFDRATGSPVDLRMAELIAGDGPLMVTEPVLRRCWPAHADDTRETDLRRRLLRFRLAHFDAVTDFNAAARIHRRCRKADLTPRGTVDCMIAAVAHRHALSLLARDADMVRVADVIGIELDPASRHG